MGVAMTDTCQRCRFFVPSESGRDTGYCRFNPPQVIQGTNPGTTAAIFPIVKTTWWCGQFMPGSRQ